MRAPPRVLFVLILATGTARCRLEPAGAADAPLAAASADDDATTSDMPTGGTASSTGGAASTPSRAGASGAATSPTTAAGGTSSHASAPDPLDAAGTEPGTSPEQAPAAGAPGGAEIPGGTVAPSAACDAQSVNFDEIQVGQVRSNAKIRIEATATSQKFLLSHARSGSCLFAAFAGIEPTADAPRGLLLVSYGDDAPSDAACATDTDAIPSDLATGDAITATGYFTAYAPSGCAAAPSPELVVDVSCPLARNGRREPPSPVVLSLERADAIARGTDAALLRRFAGGLVRLEHVSAARPTDGNGSVAPYGVIDFVETALSLHNDIEYGDLRSGGPGNAQKSLVFPYPTAFTSVTGLVYLDYCTWSLAPRSRCDDLEPASENCR